MAKRPNLQVINCRNYAHRVWTTFDRDMEFRAREGEDLFNLAVIVALVRGLKRKTKGCSEFLHSHSSSITPCNC